MSHWTTHTQPITQHAEHIKHRTTPKHCSRERDDNERWDRGSALGREAEGGVHWNKVDFPKEGQQTKQFDTFHLPSLKNEKYFENKNLRLVFL